MHTPDTLPLLELRGIQCQFGQQEVVKGVSFALLPGHIACLLGPSGCGKTTTLRAIAGLEPIVAGEILLDGNVISSASHSLPPEKRQLGMVFQEHALFPHLKVRQNIGFGLQHLPRNERPARIAHALALVRMEAFAERYPHELSGGQQQRVALARALAQRPRLILLDEPFSSLDLDLRRQLNLELQQILKQERMTAVMVTHDQTEAFGIADSVGVMKQGALVQWDSPRQVYRQPAERFVAEFTGRCAVIPASQARQLATEAGATLDIADQQQLLLRPEAVQLTVNGPHRARLIRNEFTGSHLLAELQLASGEALFSLAPNHAELGAEACFQIDWQAIALVTH